MMQEFSEQKKWILEKTIEQIRPKSTKDLTADDKYFLRLAGVMNGCGGKNRGIFQKILLKFLTPVFFEASCNLHDFGYWKGWDEARRLECDRKFYEKILEDIENEYRGNFWLKFDFFAFLEYQKYKILAKIFYLAVRLGGRQFFNYY